MECFKCKTKAPDNLISFNKSTWTCPSCEVVKLQDELHRLYQTGVPGRWLYVSDLSNNLSKISQFFTDSVDLNNPFCTITLTLPEGCDKLKGEFDGVYIDQGSVDESHLKSIYLTSIGTVFWVEPTTMTII